MFWRIPGTRLEMAENGKKKKPGCSRRVKLGAIECKATAVFGQTNHAGSSFSLIVPNTEGMPSRNGGVCDQTRS